MIIGNGMIAKAFAQYRDREDVCIFASGVSYSKEISSTEFLREENLLISTILNCRNKTFVYFSSCGVRDDGVHQNLYYKHKKRMEDIIRLIAGRYMIVRLTQVVGHTSSQTLVQFFAETIQKGESFVIETKSIRNIIDVEDVVKTVSFLIDNELCMNTIIPLGAPIHIYAKDIVFILENILKKEACYKYVDTGTEILISHDHLEQYWHQAGVTFSKDYPEKILRKYYE
jgi:nucleoside-diphosphate-sugar epimerase